MSDGIADCRLSLIYFEVLEWHPHIQMVYQLVSQQDVSRPCDASATLHSTARWERTLHNDWSLFCAVLIAFW